MRKWKKTAPNRGFVKLGHLCYIWTLVILMNFGAVLNICALKTPTSQSPKTLQETLNHNYAQKKNA